jgi:hypothetical protein
MDLHCFVPLFYLAGRPASVSGQRLLDILTQHWYGLITANIISVVDREFGNFNLAN